MSFCLSVSALCLSGQVMKGGISDLRWEVAGRRSHFFVLYCTALHGIEQKGRIHDRPRIDSKQEHVDADI